MTVGCLKVQAWATTIINAILWRTIGDKLLSNLCYAVWLAEIMAAMYEVISFFSIANGCALLAPMAFLSRIAQCWCCAVKHLYALGTS